MLKKYIDHELHTITFATAHSVFTTALVCATLRTIVFSSSSKIYLLFFRTSPTRDKPTIIL